MSETRTAKVHVVLTVEITSIVRNDHTARRIAVEQWGDPDTIDVQGAYVEWAPDKVSDDD